MMKSRFDCVPRRFVPLAGCIAAALGLSPLAALASSGPLPLVMREGRISTRHSGVDLNLPSAGLPALTKEKAKTGGKADVAQIALHGARSVKVTGRQEFLVGAGLKAAPVSSFGFLSAPGPAMPSVAAHPVKSVPLVPPGKGGVDVHGARSVAGVAQAKPAVTFRPALTTQGAGVVLDNSLGQTTQPITTTNSSGQNDYGVDASMGRANGGNLYFSFSSFSLATKESVTFTGPASVQEILARVTGGSVSSIDGAINCRIPGANLFLLNPAGFVFGPNASLNLNGSFVVSTADYIKFADGSKFSAMSSPIADAALGSAAVSAFGFLNSTLGTVQFNGSQLAVPVACGLHVIAGGVTLTSGTNSSGVNQGANLSAPSGALTFFGASSAGEVPFNMISPGTGYASASASAGGGIALSNQSSLSIDGNGGGSIALYGGAMTVDNSTISSNNYGSTIGGSINIQAQTLSVLNGGRIATTANAVGNGGSIAIQAGQLTVDGDNGTIFSSIRSNTVAGTGNGGALNVNATGIALTDGGDLEADSHTGGNGGDVIVTADHLLISGYTGFGAPGIFANCFAGGNSGLVSVDVTGGIAITAGGQISVSTFSSGTGGTVMVSAGTLAIDGSATPTRVTGILALSNPGAFGNAGNLTVNVANALTITNSGEISAGTFSSGTGGNIVVTAGSLSIAGSVPPGLFTGISGESSAGATGNGGNVTVSVTNGIAITSGGEIAASTFGAGKGGDLNITAGSLMIDDSAIPTSFTGIANASNPGATGDGGRVTVTVTNGIAITGGGEIAAGTFSSGNGGDLRVTAGSLTIDGSVAGSVFTGISASSDPSATGNAGDLTVYAADIHILGGGQILGGTESVGLGGALSVKVSSIFLDGNYSGIFDNSGDPAASGPSGNGGDAQVSAGQISIKNGARIVANAFSTGNAGTLTITAGSLSIDGAGFGGFTGISADSIQGAKGNAGNVILNVANALMIVGGGTISADTSSIGTGGSLSISAGSLTIDGSAVPTSYTGISTDSNQGATGNAGSLTVCVAKVLTITGCGVISADTSSSGKGGDLKVSAGSLTIDGSAAPTYFTGISTDSNQGATGNAGDLTICVAKALTLTGSGGITADTNSSGKGGDLKVTAGSLTIDGSATPAYFTGISTDANQGTGMAGDLEVTVSNELMIRNSGAIGADTFSPGSAGNLSVTAHSLLIDGSGTPTIFTGISAQSNSGATGDAGNLTVAVAKAIVLTGGGQISADTFSSGNGGSLSVTAGALTIDGSATPAFFTGISADSNQGATGNAGNAVVKVANSIAIRGSGEISASTYSNGNGGGLTVDAAYLTIDGSSTAFAQNGFETGIFARSNTAGTIGNSGDLAVGITNALTITGHGEISASTFSDGSAGNLKVSAGSLTIDGTATPKLFTGITASSNVAASGNAGDLTVTVSGLLTLTSGGEIAATTFSSGNGGDLHVSAGSLTIDGADARDVGTGISAESLAGASGKSGNIVVNSGSIGLTGTGDISAISQTAAPGGSVFINASSLSLAAGGSVTSANSGSGSAGSVKISVTGSVELDGASSISSMAAQSDAGSIQLTAGGNIELSHNSSITVQGLNNNAGDIVLWTPNVLALHQSQVTAQAGLNGGNITLSLGYLLLDGSQITANASRGAGGVIIINLSSADAVLGDPGAFRIVSPYVFQSGDSSISASSSAGIPGSLLVAAPKVDLANGLLGLPDGLLDASSQLREQCATRLGQEFSSLLLLGSGGVATAPDDPQANDIPPAAAQDDTEQESRSRSSSR